MTPGHVKDEESLLSAPEVQRILVKLYEGENVEFKAAIVDNQTIGYRELEKLAEVDSRRANQILDLLESEGILVKEPYQFFFACPNCDSKDLLLRIRCPSCKGEAFKVGNALEHLNCGHAELEEAFVTPDGFRCPNCKKSLKTIGVDYRRFSNYYSCVNCGRLSGIVDDLLLCNKCGRKLPLEEARHGTLSTYRYVPESRAKVEASLSALYGMKAKLSARHFTSKLGGDANGKSGIQHHFDLLAWPDDEPEGERRPSIVVDVMLAREPLDGQIAASVAKALDVGCPNTFLVVIPRATSDWIKMASYYGITIIECPTVAQVAFQIESAVMGAVSSTSRKKPRDTPITMGKPEPAAPSRQIGSTVEDAVILDAIVEKQEELARMIQWLIMKSKIPVSQPPGTPQTTKEVRK